MQHIYYELCHRCIATYHNYTHSFLPKHHIMNKKAFKIKVKVRFYSLTNLLKKSLNYGHHPLPEEYA